MKTSNNFQSALPASFELLNIISTDFFRFSKVKTKSRTFPEMNKTVLYPRFMKKIITCLHISGATSATA